ncbi:MAG: 50S ribosomal protein L15 [Acidobacteria bacterium]|nr:50S ribosomal protein L15 [Acidobacteriota bacterium]
MGLNNLRPAEGSTHKKKRVGRGPGSGLGKTAGRGNKGQKSRSGYSGKVGFEGGQMPLQRRLPKRGFTNIFKKQWIEVTLSTLENSFEAGDSITPETMHERGVIAKGKRDVVVLGTGELTKALTVSAHRFTKGARAKIEAAGGTVNVVSAHHKADALVPVSE